jgi:hypothetical protein
MNQVLKNLFALILIVPQLVSGAEEMASDQVLGSRLADCGAFFKLLSLLETPFAEGMKAASVAATGYAIVAFPDYRQAEIEIGKSMVNLADEIPKLQKDQDALEKKFENCIATLKTGEAELRPKMDESMKILVPELFGGN